MSGISNYMEDRLLNNLRNTSGAVAAVWVKLHISDPGETATSGAATEATRKSISFSAASGGEMASSGTVTWTNVSTTETYSHFSLWDAESSGNALWKGALSSTAAVTAGDTFNITSLTLTLD